MIAKSRPLTPKRCILLAALCWPLVLMLRDVPPAAIEPPAAPVEADRLVAKRPVAD